MPGRFPALSSGVSFKYPITRGVRQRTKVHRFIDLSEQRYGQGANILTDFNFVFNSISTADKERIRTFYGQQNGEAATDWLLEFEGFLYIGCQFVGMPRYDYINPNLWNVTLQVRTIQSLTDGAEISTVIPLPHGTPVSGILNILSSHILGGDPVGVIFGLDQVGLFDRGFFGDNSAWTLRVNSVAVNPAEIYSSLALILTFGTAFPGPQDPPELLLVYDVWLQVTFADGTHATLRPTTFDTNTAPFAAQGTVTNPENSFDSDPTTFATLSKTSHSTIDLGPALILKTWR